jgi:hypothetical protein
MAEVNHAEFEIMKRNLMRDVTDRCEKVSRRGPHKASGDTDICRPGRGTPNPTRRGARKIQGDRTIDERQGPQQENADIGIQPEPVE